MVTPMIVDSTPLLPDATAQLAALDGKQILPQILRRYRQAASKNVESADNLTQLSNLLEQRRPATFQHCQRVARLAVLTGRALSMSNERLLDLQLAARLHDVGKIFVPHRIVRAPRRLKRFELRLMQQHARFGALLMSAFNLPAALRVRILHHHERWDGKGYPTGLAGDAIPICSRVIHVCDAFDAMTVERPYTTPRPKHEALQELRAGAGTQFDSQIVEAFCDAQRNAPHLCPQ